MTERCHQQSDSIHVPVKQVHLSQTTSGLLGEMFSALTLTNCDETTQTNRMRAITFLVKQKSLIPSFQSNIDMLNHVQFHIS